MFKLRQLRCSFCRKGEAEVEKLVAGPHVYICDACVAIATKMMEGGLSNDSQPPPVTTSMLRRLLGRVQVLWSGGNAGVIEARINI